MWRFKISGNPKATRHDGEVVNQYPSKDSKEIGANNYGLTNIFLRPQMKLQVLGIIVLCGLRE